MAANQSSESNYYETHNLLFKPLNVIKRNAQRLQKVSVNETILELIKNAIEHGNGNIKISIEPQTDKDYPNKIIIFNTVDDKTLKEFSFQHLLQKLMTFNATTETNFHEGLTTLLLFHTQIRVKHYGIMNKKSEDGFYQYIERASHYIDEEGNEIQIENLSSIQGWQVIIFNPPQDIEKIVIDCLSRFYLIDGFYQYLYLNQIPYSFAKFDTKKEFTLMKVDGDLLFDLNYSGNTTGIIEIYWRLNHQKTFQKLANTQFNERKINGRVILTTIHQFANENRVEVSSKVQDVLEREILTLQKSHQGEMDFEEDLSHYIKIKQEYFSFFVESLGISMENFQKLCNDINPRETILSLTNFIHTLIQILNLHKEYQRSPPKLVFSPNQPPKIISAVDFFNIFKKLGIPLSQFRDRYPHLPIGLKILYGDPEGFLFCADLAIFMYGQRVLQIIDPKLNFQDLLNFENDIPLLYPIHPFVGHLLADINTRYIKSAQEFRKYPAFIIRNILQLQDFAIIPDIHKKITHKSTSTFPKKTEYSESDGYKISQMNASRLEFNGTMYDLSIFQFISANDYWKIPIMFKSPFLKEIETNLFQSTDLRRRSRIFYNALTSAIELIVCNTDFPVKTLYPTYFFEPGGPTALYLGENGIVAYNLIKLPNFDNSLSNSLFLLDIVAHELAHEFAPNHGHVHEQHFESILTRTRGHDKKTNRLIIEIIQNLLMQY